MASIVGVTQATASKVGVTPAGAIAGDELIFFVSAYGNTSSVAAGATTFTPPTGAVFVTTLQVNFSGLSAGPTTVWVYRLQIVGAPLTTYTFTIVGDGAFGGTEVATICLRGYGNVGEFSSQGNGTGSTTITAPTLTTQTDNELLIWYYWGENQTIVTPPFAGLGTQQINGTANPTTSAEGMWTMIQTSKGATGAVTATATSDDWIAVMVAVRLPNTTESLFLGSGTTG